TLGEGAHGSPGGPSGLTVAERIFDQEPKRLDDRRFDGALRSPSERSQPSRVEQDLGRVAHPASNATAIVQLGCDAELGADDADAGVDLDPIRVTDVVDVNAGVGLGLFDGEQHGIDAVEDVAVRLALMPVPEDIERGRVLLQLAPEVDDVAVR